MIRSLGGSGTVGHLRGWERSLRASWARDGAPAGPVARWELAGLAGIVTLAALLRFWSLGWRGYWVDEAVVVMLVKSGPAETLARLLSGQEGTPPLYYELAWAWSRVFGTDEVGLRSLSALLGTATVPVAFLAGRELLSARAGLVSGLTFATSPILVWHSQDARAHTIAVLLSGLSLLFFVRALREPRGTTLAWWALASALGVLSHYYVAFPVAVEAVWLLAAFGSRRAVWWATGAVVVAGAGALSIALRQRENVDLTYGQYAGLGSRLVQTAAQVLVGEQPPLQRTTAALAALLILPAIGLLLWRATPALRRGAAVAAAVGGLALATMVATALLGANYMSPRNALPVLLALVLVWAAGVSAAGSVPAALLASVPLWLLFVVVDVTTASVPKFEREDWRGAARALGPPEVDRAVVVTPLAGRGPMRVYLRGAQLMPPAGARVRELDVVGLAPLFRKVGRGPRPPHPATPLPVPASFRAVDHRQARYFTVLRFRARSPVRVHPGALARAAIGSRPAAVLVQRAQARAG